MDFPVKPKHYRYSTPEVIDVDPQAFTQATQMSAAYTNEALRWRAYVNGLGLLAFKQWLQERLADVSIVNCSSDDLSQGFTFLGVGEFKYCLMITDSHESDCELLFFPKSLIDSPTYIAHFYIFLEVIEEAEKAIIIGFIRHDQLHQFLLSTPENYYHLRHIHLDQEPNHLLLYTRYLSPSAIALPTADQTAPMTQLRGWLRGLFDESWQTLDRLLDFPPASVNFSFRGGDSPQAIPIRSSASVKRGKLLESSLEYQQEKIALLIGLTATETAEVNVSVEVSAVTPQAKLPENLQLLLLDEIGDIVMKAEANQPQITETIKLLFSGELGDRFTVQVILDQVRFTEVFEI